ncbi:MAG: xanthine dehydrogenase family protein molybdopterin-binding subunit [Candidatus Aminicenantes bacterium]|nr:MAG: xanthine dehydrogenase family protein molybdopterin-binding subunit [Candidatus Aminicenantes bacterium]
MEKKDSRYAMEDSNLWYETYASDQTQHSSEALSSDSDKKFKLIGKHIKRIDGKKIVTGKAPFTQDIKLKGMLIGKILRSPHAKAEVLSIKLDVAKSLSGVKAAILMIRGNIQYAGQMVAAVAAVDEKTADKALELIKVEYKPMPFVVIEEKAREEGSPQVHDKRPNVEQRRGYSRGDVEAGFGKADVVIERTYKTAVEIHQTAETHVSIAKWQGERLTIWDSTQAIHSVRDQLAEVLQIPASRIKVIKQYMGGGFGSKLGLNEQTVAASMLAKETNRPVKVMLTRKANSLCVGNRPSTFQTYKGGVKKDGTITALSLLSHTSGGIRGGDRSSEPMIDVHKCENAKVEDYNIYMNTGPSKPTRAPGLVQGTFGLEGFIEELANEIGMDPLEFRKKNYTTKNRGGTGIPYSSKGLDKAYEIGAKQIGWHKRNKVPGEGKGRIRRGIGMAAGIWWGAGSPGTLADVKLHPDGSVEAVCGTQDIGCGTRTHMAIVTAETLGLEPKDITVKLGNSDYPWAPLSGGSLTTPSVAPALRDAALKAAEHLKGMAASKLKVSASSIVCENFTFQEKGNPKNATPFKEVLGDLSHEIVFHGERKGLPEGYAYNTFGAHFAEVEVDTMTGMIKVIKVVAVHDSGRIINKLTAESQVIGGITQGLSTALFEQRIMDNETGRMVNPNLRDYKIATSMDIPEIVPLFVDSVDPRINILGTKGLGEPPRIPASAVIANSVYNAIGIHIREIPMTPDKVLQALKEKEVAR